MHIRLFYECVSLTSLSHAQNPLGVSLARPTKQRRHTLSPAPALSATRYRRNLRTRSPRTCNKVPTADSTVSLLPRCLPKLAICLELPAVRVFPHMHRLWLQAVLHQRTASASQVSLHRYLLQTLPIAVCPHRSMDRYLPCSIISNSLIMLLQGSPIWSLKASFISRKANNIPLSDICLACISRHLGRYNLQEDSQAIIHIWSIHNSSNRCSSSRPVTKCQGRPPRSSWGLMANRCLFSVDNFSLRVPCQLC